MNIHSMKTPKGSGRNAFWTAALTFLAAAFAALAALSWLLSRDTSLTLLMICVSSVTSTVANTIEAVVVSKAALLSNGDKDTRDAAGE